MKLQLSIITILLLIFTSSCSDFLAEEPTTLVSKSVVFQDEATLRVALNGVHSQMMNYWYRTALYNMNSSLILACPFETVSNTVSYGVLDELKPGNNILNSPFYQQAYKVIEYANVLIDGANSSPVSSEKKSKIVGEAKFLRAVTYFDLVRLYGRVPLRLHPIVNYEDALVSRTSLKTIYDAIISDFSDAFLTMPTASEQMSGMPHRYAAEAYLAKVYVQLACLTDDHLEATQELGKESSDKYSGTAERMLLSLIPDSVRNNYSSTPRIYFWTKATECSKDVINNGGYSLQVPFGSLFRGRTRNTAESIFEHQYSSNYGFGAGISARTAPDIRTELNFPMMENNVYGQITANYAVFQNHFMKYCRKTSRTGDTPTSITDIIDNKLLNSDPRFNETYVFYSYKAYVPRKSGVTRDSMVLRYSFPHKEFRPDAANSCYPYIKKFLDSTQVSSQNSNVNYIVFRLADVYLLYAESLNELGNTTEAIDVVNNFILDRARRSGKFDTGKTPYPKNWTPGLSQDSVRRAIMQEREFELLGEGHETMDVRRRGVVYLKMKIQENDQFYIRNRTNTYWYQVRNWPGGANPNGSVTSIKKWHMVYSELNDNYKRDPLSFCKKHLFFPFPQNELNLNTGIQLNDQNYGW